MSRPKVHYSAEAAARLATLERTRQGRLRHAIGRVGAAGPAGRFIHVRTTMDIAACEVLEERGLVLVYAIVPRRELLRMLWGGEVDEKVRRREVSRLMHGRWSS